MLATLLLWSIPLLFAITVHEVAHGWVACKLGDKTALMLGRLTLNPIKHIDPIGTILVPVMLFFLSGFIFGWAKPVPVTQENLRVKRRDMAIVALAGPAANIMMAVLWGSVAKISLMLLQNYPFGGFKILVFMGQAGISINLVLATLNLLPILPLDGGRIVENLLPPRLSFHYAKTEPYGLFIIMGLLVFGALKYVLFPPIQIFSQLIYRLLGLM